MESTPKLETKPKLKDPESTPLVETDINDSDSYIDIFRKSVSSGINYFVYIRPSDVPVESLHETKNPKTFYFPGIDSTGLNERVGNKFRGLDIILTDSPLEREKVFRYVINSADGFRAISRIDQLHKEHNR